MLVVGLTGGIATGKSTVCDMLKARGAYVVDTDKIAREVVEPGEPCWREVVDFFGKEILATDGTINREKLGRIVFNSRAKREALESILHPKILEKKEQTIKEIRKNDPRAIVIVEIPLLIEVDRQSSVDAVLLVYVSPQVQIERLTARDGSALKDAQSRISSQMPIDEKVQYADFVVNNEGSLVETEKEVDKIYEKLKEMVPGK